MTCFRCLWTQVARRSTTFRWCTCCEDHTAHLSLFVSHWWTATAWGPRPPFSRGQESASQSSKARWPAESWGKHDGRETVPSELEQLESAFLHRRFQQTTTGRLLLPGAGGRESRTCPEMGASGVDEWIIGHFWDGEEVLAWQKERGHRPRGCRRQGAARRRPKDRPLHLPRGASGTARPARLHKTALPTPGQRPVLAS